MASAAPIVAAEAGGRPSAQATAPERQGREDDLPEPKPEHQPAHEPQPLERQFEPHGEEECDDAERGELVDRLDIDRECAQPGRLLAEPAEAVRSERDARQQISEHRTDAEAEEEGRDDARRRQEKQRLLVNRKVGRLVHGRGFRHQDAASLAEAAEQYERRRSEGDERIGSQARETLARIAARSRLRPRGRPLRRSLARLMSGGYERASDKTALAAS